MEYYEAVLKAFLPPRPDHKVVTPLLKKGGEIFDIKYLNFLLFDRGLPRDAARRSGEEYPDRSVGGRWWLLRQSRFSILNMCSWNKDMPQARCHDFCQASGAS